MTVQKANLLDVDLASRVIGSAGHQAIRRPVGEVIVALAGAASDLSSRLSHGPFAGDLAADTGQVHADGDCQKSIDVIANELMADALKRTPTAYYASEEEDAILTLSRSGVLAVAVDPLDGSSNADTNVSVGSIFSIYEALREGATASFLRSGKEQLAAGYFIYGPHTSLVLTTGDGVDIYVLDPTSREFRLARNHVAIPRTSREYAINASNARHWPAGVSAYIKDCLAGSDGPLGRNHNTRWIASMVAEAHRIFMRGGIYLYPADRRDGYRQGRLRLLYEAAPIAFLCAEAGGVAIDGTTPILERTPKTLHERTPLVFGSADQVEQVRQYCTDDALGRDPPPLFAERGLFRT